MKSILYVGLIAMAGASIYGFVDYRKTANSKAFNTMYVEPTAAEPEAIAVKEPATASKSETTVIKKETVVNTAKVSVKRKKDVFSKKRKNEKKINYTLFSRAPLRELEEMIPVETEKVAHQ